MSAPFEENVNPVNDETMEFGVSRPVYRLLSRRWRKVVAVAGPTGELRHESQRFERGDLIEDISDEDAARLLRIGAIEVVGQTEDEDGAEDDEDDEDQQSPESASEDPSDPVIPEEASENVRPVETEPEPETVPEGQGGATEGQGDESGSEQPAETYAEWSYASLQQEAKGRDLNGGGSADDLRERLIENDRDVAAKQAENDTSE